MRRYVLAGLVLAATVLGIGLSHHPDPRPAAAAGPVAAPTAAAPNAVDVAFAQMMVAHHEQAVRMSTALIAKPGVPERIRLIAEFVAHDQQREIDETNAWLSAWGVTGAHEHADGHGMLTEAQLTELDRAPASKAGRLFLTQMMEHHRGAITMARSLLDAGGRNVYTHGLAKHVINEQTDENTAMAKLLTETR